MALFHTTVLDNQIKVLPTTDTASGSIATFDTDLTENLVEVKCQIVAKQASGTPSPVNPLPITVYTSLNLSHSGSDTSNPNVTNIPFGQTVANGVLDITTGKLTITDKIVDFGDLGYYYSNGRFSSTDIPDVKNVSVWNSTLKLCSCYEIAEVQTWTQGDFIIGMYAKNIYVKDSRYTDPISFKQALTGQKFIVELANPIVLSITSQDIPTLLNENNIWCDTGDTEVKYLLTVGKKIS